jgi:predicted MFS family arabinose efflux permease
LLGAYFDNIRGPLLPVFSVDFTISPSLTSYLIVVGNFVGLVTLLALPRVVRAVNDHALTLGLFVAALAFVGLVFSVQGFYTLVPYAALFGLFVATFGSICNLLVITGTPVQHRARTLSALHSIYGLGSWLAGVACGVTALNAFGWRNVLLYASPVIAIAIIAMLRKNTFPPDIRAEVGRSARPAGKVSLALVSTFALYVCGEVLFSTWLASYLVFKQGVSAEAGALTLSGFFAVMGISRLLSGIFLRERIEVPLIVLSLVAGIAALGVGLWSDWAAAFMAVGLLGPFYPVLLGRVSRQAPDGGRVLTLRIILATQTSLMLGNLLVGQVAAHFGVGDILLLPVFFLFATFGSLFVIFPLLGSRAS